jgi:hypothetical protein
MCHYQAVWLTAEAAEELLLATGIDACDSSPAIGDPQRSIRPCQDRLRPEEIVSGESQVTSHEMHPPRPVAIRPPVSYFLAFIGSRFAADNGYHTSPGGSQPL